MADINQSGDAKVALVEEEATACEVKIANTTEEQEANASESSDGVKSAKIRKEDTSESAEITPEPATIVGTVDTQIPEKIEETMDTEEAASSGTASKNKTEASPISEEDEDIDTEYVSDYSNIENSPSPKDVNKFEETTSDSACASGFSPALNIPEVVESMDTTLFPKNFASSEVVYCVAAALKRTEENIANSSISDEEIDAEYASDDSDIGKSPYKKEAENMDESNSEPDLKIDEEIETMDTELFVAAAVPSGTEKTAISEEVVEIDTSTENKVDAKFFFKLISKDAETGEEVELTLQDDTTSDSADNKNSDNSDENIKERPSTSYESISNDGSDNNASSSKDSMFGASTSGIDFAEKLKSAGDTNKLEPVDESEEKDALEKAPAKEKKNDDGFGRSDDKLSNFKQIFEKSFQYKEGADVLRDPRYPESWAEYAQYYPVVITHKPAAPGESTALKLVPHRTLESLELQQEKIAIQKMDVPLQMSGRWLDADEMEDDKPPAYCRTTLKLLKDMLICAETVGARQQTISLLQEKPKLFAAFIKYLQEEMVEEETPTINPFLMSSLEQNPKPSTSESSDNAVSTQTKKKLIVAQCMKEICLDLKFNEDFVDVSCEFKKLLEGPESDGQKETILAVLKNHPHVLKIYIADKEARFRKRAEAVQGQPDSPEPSKSSDDDEPSKSFDPDMQQQ